MHPGYVLLQQGDGWATADIVVSFLIAGGSAVLFCSSGLVTALYPNIDWLPFKTPL
jgi:hypothetical protein